MTAIAICIVCAGGVVHAQVFDPFSSIVAGLTQQTELIVATLSSFATGQWSALQSWYTVAGFDNNAQHGYESTQFKDSAGNILTIEVCAEIGNYHRITQKVCTSAPNKCGAVATGFETDFYEYFTNKAHRLKRSSRAPQ